MSDQEAFLGVSLSNKTFTRGLAVNFFEWLIKEGFTHLEIALADKLEPINYSVFRSVSLEAAQSIATNRSDELERMFQGAFTSLGKENLNISITRFSNHPMNSTDAYQKARRLLYAAYDCGGSFSKDVNATVLHNLQARIETHGEDFIFKNMATLATYILEEVVFFYALFRLHPTLVEIYPGQNLLVKERLFSGAYSSEITGLTLSPQPQFVDVSFLSTS